MAVHRNRADVQQPLDLRQHAGSQDIARRGDRFFLEISPSAPIAHLGGAMVDDARPLDRPPHRGRTAEIPLNDLGPLRPQERQIAARPNQHAHAFAGAAQLLDDMAAELPRRAGHEIDFVGHACSRFPPLAALRSQ